jgi:hydroxypyruvate isomerase
VDLSGYILGFCEMVRRKKQFVFGGREVPGIYEERVTRNGKIDHIRYYFLNAKGNKAEDHAGYFEQIEKMIAFAQAVGCKQGIVLSGLSDPALSENQMRDNLTKALAQATEMAQAAGITLLLEPLNSRVDHAGYYLDTTEKAIPILREINSENLKMLYDVYHMQIMEGNLLATIENNIDIIGHFHAAGVPGRAEMFDTEINYPAIVEKLESLNYQGNFGLEYFPQITDHSESLKRISDYLQ